MCFSTLHFSLGLIKLKTMHEFILLRGITSFDAMLYKNSLAHIINVFGRLYKSVYSSKNKKNKKLQTLAVYISLWSLYEQYLHIFLSVLFFSAQPYHHTHELPPVFQRCLQELKTCYQKLVVSVMAKSLYEKTMDHSEMQ